MTDTVVDNTLLYHILAGYLAVFGLSKNRRDDDGTGRSILPTAGGHIVALMTRWGGREVDGTV